MYADEYGESYDTLPDDADRCVTGPPGCSADPGSAPTAGAVTRAAETMSAAAKPDNSFRTSHDLFESITKT
jgi:hypothetical protein